MKLHIQGLDTGIRGRAAQAVAEESWADSQHRVAMQVVAGLQLHQEAMEAVASSADIAG